MQEQPTLIRLAILSRTNVKQNKDFFKFETNEKDTGSILLENMKQIFRREILLPSSRKDDL